MDFLENRPGVSIKVEKLHLSHSFSFKLKGKNVNIELSLKKWIRKENTVESVFLNVL